MLKITGLEELTKKLDDISNRLDDLAGEHNVSLTDVLTPEFISANSRFANADQLFEAAGLKFENQEEFAAIPEDALDSMVQSNTSFASWKDLLTKAGEQWAANKLGF